MSDGWRKGNRENAKAPPSSGVAQLRRIITSFPNSPLPLAALFRELRKVRNKAV